MTVLPWLLPAAPKLLPAAPWLLPTAPQGFMEGRRAGQPAGQPPGLGNSMVFMKSIGFTYVIQWFSWKKIVILLTNSIVFMRTRHVTQ